MKNHFTIERRDELQRQLEFKLALQQHIHEQTALDYIKKIESQALQERLKTDILELEYSISLIDSWLEK